ELTGTLTVPPMKDKPASKPLTMTGESAIDYDERVLSVERDGQVQKTLRLFRRVDVERKVGDQPQETTVRPAVRRIVVLRNQNTEVPFSPDGPLTWGEIDLIRTDVFTPALAGLFSESVVSLGERWKAATPAVKELTDLEQIDEGGIECKFEQVVVIEKRRHARVSFSGSVRGVNEDGPNKQTLEGFLYFDLESNHLSYLSLRGTHLLFDKDGKEAGRVEGRFVLTRQ